MGFLFRLVVFGALFVVLGIVVLNFLPDVKQSAVEFINPAIKEQRLLSELEGNVRELEGSLVARFSATASPSSDVAGALSEADEKTKALLEDSKKLIAEISDINETKVSTVSAGISRVTDLVKEPLDKLGITNNDSEVLYTSPEGIAYVCTEVKQ